MSLDPPSSPFLWSLGSLILDLGLSRTNFLFPFHAQGPRVSLCLEAWAVGEHSFCFPFLSPKGTQSPLLGPTPDNVCPAHK